MGNAPSPVITKAQVKAHLKYVWAQQKLKFRLRKVKVRGKVEAEAYRLWQRFPYRVVNKNNVPVDDRSWLSAQDLYLPSLFGEEGQIPIVKGPLTIRPVDRGDTPMERSLSTEEFKKRLGLPREV
jgi:hypothetical protein